MYVATILETALTIRVFDCMKPSVLNKSGLSVEKSALW